MKLVVHFGMHKTGSSSIQESLAANLSDPGFTYLNFGQANGSLAVRRGFDENFARKTLVAQRSPSQADLDEARRKGRQAVRRALRSCRTETGIISAEALTNLSEDGLAGFARLLGKFSDDITAVGYIRPVKAYVESVFQQRLKRGAVGLTPGTFQQRYRSKFEKFDSVFGADRVQFWKFDPKTLFGGDVVLDFCARLGIAFDPADVIRVNDGLSAPAVQLLYIYRQYHPTYDPRDKTVVDLLSGLKGPKLRLQSNWMRDLVAMAPEELDGLEARIGADLKEDWAANDAQAFSSEAELLSAPDAALNWLAQQSGGKRADSPAAVAQTLAALGETGVEVTRSGKRRIKQT
ncbi:MAG: hypothetical protein GY949_23445 [Gammaproteobacteria bacterium]|nr:hypothetical protein [Gammaproteobacteria bacterium]